MIDYLPSESDIFTSNKMYCETTCAALKDKGYSIKGSCSSYGYTLLAQAKKEGLSLNLKLEKNQSTQGGNVMFNPGAVNTEVGQLRIEGLSTAFTIRLGQSGLVRLFSTPEARMIIPKPAYLFWTKNCPADTIQKLALFVKTHSVYAFKLNRGKVLLKFDGPKTNIPQFLSEALNLVKNAGFNS
ncbi:MAG: hypothetical protein HYZ14_08840 [Bacteroidetes bacterium]|nr:hypothetical protein [Bacteroidota bacterium]